MWDWIFACWIVKYTKSVRLSFSAKLKQWLLWLFLPSHYPFFDALLVNTLLTVQFQFAAFLTQFFHPWFRCMQWSPEPKNGHLVTKRRDWTLVLNLATNFFIFVARFLAKLFFLPPRVVKVESWHCCKDYPEAFISSWWGVASDCMIHFEMNTEIQLLGEYIKTFNLISM